MKRNLKLLSGVVGFAMLVNVLAFAACTPVEEEPVEENNPPVVVVPKPEPEGPEQEPEVQYQ